MYDFLAGAATATLMLLIALAFSEADKIEECERDLPRTESCVLIAVPESEVN